MRAPHPYLAAIAGATVVALLVAGCTTSRPVHPDIDWDGQHAGPYEDDPRVQALRQALVQINAADNALNYSEPDLLEVASIDWLERQASLVDTRIRVGQMQLWEGPASFSVADITESESTPGASIVTVCERLAPWFSLSNWWADPANLRRTLRESPYTATEQDGGVYYFEMEFYVEGSYTLTEHEGRWLVDGGGSDYVECDPGPEVVTGTFSTPPDLGLLHEANIDMVIGPDGRRARR
jgi:hypothetical protein